MGELAGDKCIIRKRATQCILPRQRPCDRSRTLIADLIIVQIQRFQVGVDQCLSQCNDSAANTTWVLLLSTAVFVLEVPEPAPSITHLNDPAIWYPNAIKGQIQTGQGGAEQTVKKRAEEGKWVS